MAAPGCPQLVDVLWTEQEATVEGRAVDPLIEGLIIGVRVWTYAVHPNRWSRVGEASLAKAKADQVLQRRVRVGIREVLWRL